MKTKHVPSLFFFAILLTMYGTTALMFYAGITRHNDAIFTAGVVIFVLSLIVSFMWDEQDQYHEDSFNIRN